MQNRCDDRFMELMCRAAKLGIGVNVTDSSTERRYNLAIDGPAHSCLALPVKSGGLDGELLAVLSIRKIFPELMAGNGTYTLHSLSGPLVLLPDAPRRFYGES